jgi:hypothetical protein
MSDTKAAPVAHVARFVLEGRTYTTASLDEITLLDVLAFGPSAEAVGLNVTWVEVEELAQLMAAAEPDVEFPTQDLLLVTAATIWASRRAAGDRVTFGEAIDVPMSEIRFLPPTKDNRPDPSKARKSSKARKGSGPRVADAPQTPSPDESQTTPPTPTSGSPSDDD